MKRKLEEEKGEAAAAALIREVFLKSKKETKLKMSGEPEEGGSVEAGGGGESLVRGQACT